MTRLLASDIQHIAASLTEYEADLRLKTGLSLKGLACYAVGIDERKVDALLPRVTAQIVPVSWGDGVIPGFAAAVASILAQIGIVAGTTKKMNVAGICNAVDFPCDLLFIADDSDFIVLNLNLKKSVHNANATGKGFAAGIDLMAGGIRGIRALVVGCGPVGRSAAMELDRRGAQVSVYDLDPAQYRYLADEAAEAAAGEFNIVENIDASLRVFDYIIDASPAANLITAEMVGPQTFISAPGVPAGLSPEAIKEIGPRLLHDPLQIGVATMAIEAIAALPAS